MSFESYDKQLTERISVLQKELESCRRQKEVLCIIERLQRLNEDKIGYTNLTPDELSISFEGMSDFIGLLDSSEYIKGFSSGGASFDGLFQKRKYFTWYLNIGIGKIIELTFCETETDVKKIDKSLKDCSLSIMSFIDSQDLNVKIDVEDNNWARINFLMQNGNSVFNSNSSNEYLKFNNQRLNDVVTPISVDDLTSRFLKLPQVQEYGIRK